MTEAEWLVSVHPDVVHQPKIPFSTRDLTVHPDVVHLPKLPFGTRDLIKHLDQSLNVSQTKPGKRKLRLFACACCRRWWTTLLETTRQQVEMAERYADGNAELRQRHEHSSNAATPSEKFGPLDIVQILVNQESEIGAANAVPGWIALSVLQTRQDSREFSKEEIHQQIRLLHDIFGNPFRPARVDPAWLAWNHGTVRLLAEAIYAERAFERMPILADALEEAGCGDADLLRHCRQSDAVHVRGCWVVDLLTGRA